MSYKRWFSTLWPLLLLCASCHARTHGSPAPTTGILPGSSASHQHKGGKPTSPSKSAKKHAPPRVRVLYLVSADRRVDPERKRAIATAIKHVQKWYAGKLGGATFTLSSPVVEVAKSKQKAAWFDSNPNGKDRDVWSYNNIFAEAGRVAGARHDDPSAVWVIYSDSPGGGGRGGNGVAILPDHDLLGLMGKHPKEKNVDRWIGGLAHELGHAFGLHHTAGEKHRERAVMQLGYLTYPEAYLTAGERDQLWRSPFFSVTSANTSRSLGTYAYTGGSFERRAMKTQTYWLERKMDGRVHYTFREVSRSASHAIARDEWRKFLIKVPLKGGQSMLSTDDGKSWVKLYSVTYAKPSSSK